MVEKSKNCKNPQKTRFARKTKLPTKLVPGTVYIIEDNNDEFVDLFIADNAGRKKVIVDSTRFENILQDKLSLIDYRSDIVNIGTDYFYGYEYEDNSFKIIKVEKSNVVIQLRAINTVGTFSQNWDNRQILTYN